MSIGLALRIFVPRSAPDKPFRTAWGGYSSTSGISSSSDDEPAHFIGNGARAKDYDSTDNEGVDLSEPFIRECLHVTVWSLLPPCVPIGRSD